MADYVHRHNTKQNERFTRLPIPLFYRNNFREGEVDIQQQITKTTTGFSKTFCKSDDQFRKQSIVTFCSSFYLTNEKLQN